MDSVAGFDPPDPAVEGIGSAFVATSYAQPMGQSEQVLTAMEDSVYGETVNSQLVELFEPGQRLLDIGCGAGAWAPELRAKGATHLEGIEFAGEAADVAESRYDKLHREPVERLDLTGSDFDTIVVADVLEHLVDPWTEMTRWRQWVKPTGQIVVSVPNLQSLELLRPLLRGRFTYVDGGGMMDRTHLRWFTHQSMTDALAEAGWRVTVVGRPRLGKRGQLSRLTAGRFDRMLQNQIQMVAVSEAAQTTVK
jgi:2-polyprenyl-3-methyl-5-hydroxy-6-metoxy-1,4-benzoquinol methylase